MTRPKTAAPERRPGPAMGPMRWMASGMPPEKSLNFTSSAKRLLGMMRPERVILWVMLAFGVISVALSVLGPLMLGRATDVIFSGVVGQQFEPGMSKAHVPMPAVNNASSYS